MGETKSTANVNLVAISRVALVLVMALLLGSQLAQSVDAKKMPANGVSIAKRVEAQKNLCDIGGGSFESTKTAFGSTITTCTGGDGGAGTCVNTKQSTNCHPPLTRPTEDVQTPPTGGVYEEPSAGGVTPVVAGGAVGNSRFASADSDDQDHQTKANHGKAKKNKGGKRKK